MQTPGNPDFYLKHAFDKSYSDYGVPYVQENCDLEQSDNVVIYGHHMKNGSMFSDLCKYESEDFYQEHKTVHFDTLADFGEYGDKLITLSTCEYSRTNGRMVIVAKLVVPSAEEVDADAGH